MVVWWWFACEYVTEVIGPKLQKVVGVVSLAFSWGNKSSLATYLHPFFKMPIGSMCDWKYVLFCRLRDDASLLVGQFTPHSMDLLWLTYIYVRSLLYRGHNWSYPAKSFVRFCAYQKFGAHAFSGWGGWAAVVGNEDETPSHHDYVI